MEDNGKSLTNLPKNVRRVWHQNEWYYSITDIIQYLTESTNSADYWRRLKERAKTEGFEETLRQIVQIRLPAQDGRFRLTDTANRQTLLRIIQSIPSPRLENLKLLLAEAGEERFEEIEHPEQAIEKLKKRLRTQGYDDAWIEERIKNDLIRNELTDEWKTRGAREGVQFAILTNVIHKGTFDISIQAHKKYKFLPGKANLRDHMTPLELALTSLSEATAITLHQDRESQGMQELKRDAFDAGNAGGKARSVIEETVGHSVVSDQNHLEQPKQKQIDQLSLFEEN